MHRLRTSPGAIAPVLLGALLLAAHAIAGQPPVDVSGDTVDCHAVYGTIAFTPFLVSGGGATRMTAMVRGVLDGCVVSGPNAAELSGPSKFVGRLTGTTNDCAAIGAPIPLTGNLIVRWKASPSTPLQQTTSTIAVTSLGATAFHPALGDAAFGPAVLPDFALGIGGVTGAFTGGDDGAGSVIRLVASQDIPTFSARCNDAGVKTLAVGIGRLSLN